MDRPSHARDGGRGDGADVGIGGTAMTRVRYLFKKLPTANGELEALADALGVSRSGKRYFMTQHAE